MGCDEKTVEHVGFWLRIFEKHLLLFLCCLWPMVAITLGEAGRGELSKRWSVLL